MKQRSVEIIAEYLSQRPRARLVRLKRTGLDDYVLAIEDRRDGRTHLLRTPRDLELWLESFEAGGVPSTGSGTLRPLRSDPRRPRPGRRDV